MNKHPIIQLTELQTLFKERSFRNLPDGMLPIADKPLVYYLIEALAELGYKEISLAVSKATANNVKTLGNGEFWGVNLHIINCEIDRSIDIRLHQLTHDKVTEVMILPCHSMHDVIAIRQDRAISAMTTFATANSNDIYRQLKSDTSATRYDLDHYFADNLLALSDHQNFLIDGFELQENLYVNSGCHYPHTSITQRDGVIYIGENAHLQTSCDLSGDTVVGTGAIVDDHVTLNRTVILPNTYIGKNLNLSNCIVGPNWVYNTMTKGLITIEDEALLGACG